MAVGRKNAESKLDSAHAGAGSKPLNAIFKNSQTFLKDVPSRIGGACVVIAG
ncbi:hypothetical protein SDC9_142463 [bioreactor metagenome]|uniref:Uncharacterized protein n=1 Tax=bioreactor metagenome TaxID=1076179 RepID=A0A645E187_9ZZZZ